MIKNKKINKQKDTCMINEKILCPSREVIEKMRGWKKPTTYLECMRSLGIQAKTSWYIIVFVCQLDQPSEIIMKFKNKKMENGRFPDVMQMSLILHTQSSSLKLFAWYPRQSNWQTFQAQQSFMLFSHWRYEGEHQKTNLGPNEKDEKDFFTYFFI